MSEIVLYRASHFRGKPDPVISKIRVKKVKGKMLYTLSGKRRFMIGANESYFFSWKEAREKLWNVAEEYMGKKEMEFRGAKDLYYQIKEMEEVNGQITYE